MKIAVIGGGVAGLVSAWLLQSQDDVVLYEREPRLGGCAHTIAFRRDGVEARADVGAQFVSATMYPSFMRLLRILDVACVPRAATATLHHRHGGRPFRLGPPKDARSLLDLQSLLEIHRVIREAGELERRGDWATTVAELATSLRLDPSFRRDVLHPFVAMFCGPVLERMGTMSARAALQYPFLHRPRNPFALFHMLEVAGGMDAYVAKLRAALDRTSVHAGCRVTGVHREGGSLVVDSDAGRQAFDQVVLALPGHAAAKVLADLPEARALRTTLSEIEYIETTSTIHSDRTLMPQDRSAWSLSQLRVDGSSSDLTIWVGREQRADLFKTMAAAGTTTPARVHHQQRYLHPVMTPSYFAIQDRILALQGQAGIWVAGSYTRGYDSHEAGVTSAIRVARRLRPRSSNLARLRGAAPEPILRSARHARVAVAV